VGILSYIPLVRGLRLGSIIQAGVRVPAKRGNSLIMNNIRSNKVICLISKSFSLSAQFSRSAGSYSKIIKKEKLYCFIKLRSSAVKKISIFSMAVIGSVYYPSFRLNQSLKKNAG
jgi:ribosomal protein L2